MSNLARHVAAAKRFHAKAWEAGGGLPIMIVAFRDDYPVFTAMPGELSLLTVSQLMAAELRADEILIIADTFISVNPVNPVTNAPWRDGEMSVVASRHEGHQKGWVTDALTLAKYDRFGTAEVAVVPYTSDPLTWGQEYRADPGQPNASQLGEMTEVFNPPPNMPSMLGKIAASQEIRDDLLATVLESMGATVWADTPLGHRNN